MAADEVAQAMKIMGIASGQGHIYQFDSVKIGLQGRLRPNRG